MLSPLLLPSAACVSKYSAGSIFYYPSYHHVHNPAQRDKFRKDLDRYLSRKIGFEAVMRIRCTKGTRGQGSRVERSEAGSLDSVYFFIKKSLSVYLSV